MIAGIVFAVVMLLVAIVLTGRYVPRCPECGSIKLTELWYGETIWVCESCDTVFRVG
jgi:ribosomal protein L37AE/L43A